MVDEIIISIVIINITITEMSKMIQRAKNSIIIIIIVVTRDKALVRNMNYDVNGDNVESVIDKTDMVWSAQTSRVE